MCLVGRRFVKVVIVNGGGLRWWLSVSFGRRKINVRERKNVGWRDGFDREGSR